MELFIAIKSNLAKCFYSRNQTQLNSIVIRFLIGIISILHIVSHIIFLILEANNVKEYINSFYLITGTLAILISFFDTISKTATIFILIDLIEEIVVRKRLECPTSESIYMKTHWIVEKISKIMSFIIANMTAPLFILPKAILSFYTYFTTDLGTDAFELPLPTWFPFEWKTPTGYLVAVSLQYLMIFLAFQYLACFLVFALGIFLFKLTFAKHMITILHAINKNAKAKKAKAGNNDESKILKQFIEFIDMQSDVKEILRNLTAVYQTTIAVLFFESITTICMAMLMFQMELTSDEGADIIVFFETMVYGFWAVVMLFFASEMGQRYSNAYENIDGVIVQIDWYLLPMKIQRMLPIIKINTRKPFEVKYFGSSTCSRGAFKKITNKGYTFFMVLRKFYK